MVRTLLILVAILLLLGNAYAGQGWSGEANVIDIYALDENRAIVKLSSFSNPNSCSVNQDGDVFVNPTTQKIWFSLLLSAYMAGRPVNIYVDASCTPIWAGTSYATAGHVRLR